MSMWVDFAPSAGRRSMAHSVLQWPVGRLMATATVFGFVGFYFAAGLPPLLGRAFVPDADVVPDVHGMNARMMVDKLGLILGLLIGPLLTAPHVSSRSDVDGPYRRDTRLSRPSCARGRT